MQMRTVAAGAVLAALLAVNSGPSVAANEVDYATIKVIGTKVIEIASGPGDSSAILSKDGSRVLSVGVSKLCLLAPAQIGSWAELGCIDKPREAETRIRGPWDMRWSPNGDELLMPTHTDAFERFSDTDIAVFDPETFTRTSLTDDGVGGSVMDITQAALFDVSARWIDDNTIAFIRYEIPPGGINERLDPRLMTIDAAGGAPREASGALSEKGALIYALAISPDGKQYAYPLQERDDPDSAGIYLSKFGGEPHRLALMSEVGKNPTGMAFSADGTFLMVLGSAERTSTSGVVINVETGMVFPIAPGQPLVGAAWAPTDAAIAYITNDRENDENPGGLFVAAAPGEPGRLLIGESFNAVTCCRNEPFVWASNNTMLLGRAEDGSISVLYVQLGQ